MSADNSYWNWLREDAEAFRRHEWKYQQFRSAPALFSRDGKFARSYQGEPYDPAEWEVREGGWDHEHCRFCNLCICDADADHLKAGYTSGSEWLCPECYRRVILNSEDPETVLREAGWE